MSKTLTIQPTFRELLKRITDAIDNPKTRNRLLIRAVLELKDLAAGYPVAGKWNRAPGTRGDNVWYQRGFGTRWLKQDGTYGGNNTSKNLQQSWRTEVQKRDEFSASAFTEVNYAPFLLDPEKRVRWAERHGWQSLDEIEKEYTPRFEKLILDEVDKQIEEL
jgi:hypothetical protein